MVSAKTITTAEEYMDRYDVLHQVDEVGRSEAGGDNKIDKNEMNRAEPALALQALPDAEFEKVWGAMPDDAKRLYFLQVYPQLRRFIVIQDFHESNHFGAKYISSDSDEDALLGYITDKRDLAYFLKTPDWVRAGDGRWVFPSQEDAKLRAKAEALLKRGNVFPAGPQLVPPTTGQRAGKSVYARPSVCD